MKITTRLKFAALVPALMALVIGLTLLFSYKAIEEAQEKGKTAQRIRNSMNELNDFAHSYMEYHEDRPRLQFLAEHDSVMRLITTIRFGNSEQQQLLDRIAQNSEWMKGLFLKLVSNYERGGSEESTALLKAADKRLGGQILIRSRDAVSDASRLEGLINSEIITTQRRINTLIFLFLVATTFPLTIVLIRMMRNITTSLVTLRKGTEVIGAGNLTHRIGIAARDEIGELTGSFNRMTEQLQAVTVSKNELQREIEERKRAEELVQSTSLFPEQNPFPVLRVACDGTLLYANSGAAALLSQWQCGVGSRVPEFVQQALTTALDNAGRKELETRCGDRELSFVLVWIAERNYFNLYGRDITERKRAEEALRESEKDLNRAQAVAHIGSWRLDVRRNELLWSDETHRIFGIPKGTPMTYETFLGAVHPEDRQYVDQNWKAALRGEHYDIEHRIVVGHDVKWVRERAELEFDKDGLLLGGFGTAQDITERKKAEQALLRAKHEWERTFDAVPDLIAILDNHYRILRANRAMAQRLGLTPDQCVGKICHKVVHGLDSPPEFCPHTLTVSDGREHVAEVHDDCLAGDFLVSTTPLADEQGRNIGSVHVARDITRRKRAEEALRVRTIELEHLTETLEQRVRERTAELAKTNEALRCLSSKLLAAQEEERKRIAGEIHDAIWGCLSGIKFKVESAMHLVGQQGNAATESLETIIPMVQESIEECQRIQMDLRPSMLDDLGLKVTLSWLCRRFQTIYSEILVEQDVAIEESEIPDSLKIIIYRVIQEAMNNVAKHSKADIMRLSLRKTNGKMELMLEDDGRGFDLEKVLSVDGTRRGLLLSSMRERVELSGGSFGIQSVEGKGTIIRATWALHGNG